MSETDATDASGVKLEDLSELSVRVTGVTFEGVKRTRLDLLENVMKNCLESKTFGELTSALAEASHRLERLELLKDTKFVIDASAEGEDAVTVRVQGTERKYKIHVGTEVQKNEVGFGAGGVIYNVFGRGERLDLNASLGSQSATPLSLNFVKPIQGDPDRLLRLTVTSTLQHYLNGANFKNRLQGAALSYSFASPLCTLHELLYSLDWRHVYGIGEDASLTVRRSAGHSLKSSLSHTMNMSTLDSPVFPTRGWLARLGTELAGLGGNVKFLKNELVAKVHLPLFRDASMYSSLRLGHVMPLGGSDQKLCTIDKFQLGGPLSVRGFALNSLGPKDRRDAIGGDLSMEAGIGVSCPLSGGTRDILRGHLFSNIGILTNIVPTQSIKQNITRIRDMRPNVSVGVGLQVRLGDAKLEFNVAHPLYMQRGAIFHRGIQVGLGIEFL